VQHVTVSRADFEHYRAGERRFDLITFVASLHHMDLRAALVKARDLLTVTGEIAVVGCAANKTARDWVWSALCVPARGSGRGCTPRTRNVGVVVTEPQEGLDEIRRTADDVLPGSSVRRGLYYRYLLRLAQRVSHLGSFASILSATAAALRSGRLLLRHARLNVEYQVRGEREHTLTRPSLVPRAAGVRQRKAAIGLRQIATVPRRQRLPVELNVHIVVRALRPSVRRLGEEFTRRVSGAVGDDGLHDKEIPVVDVGFPNQLLAHRLPVTGS
jgi:hypothetical protein